MRSMIIDTAPAKCVIRRSAIATILSFLLTAVHHLYGAVRYDTGWRRDIVLHPFIALILCMLFLFLFFRKKRKVFLALYLVISSLLFVLGLGLFEGLYNHLLKNIFFFAGMGPSTFQMLFPAPTYELPNDVFFEVTGIAQFLVTLPLCHYLLKTYRLYFGTMNAG